MQAPNKRKRKECNCGIESIIPNVIHLLSSQSFHATGGTTLDFLSGLFCKTDIEALMANHQQIHKKNYFLGGMASRNDAFFSDFS